MTLNWDEPKDATTSRGWAYVSLPKHPDYRRDAPKFRKDYLSEHLCVGNYLTYITTTGPNGETVHACRYVQRVDPNCGTSSSQSRGSKWCRTVEEAKLFIEEIWLK